MIGLKFIIILIIGNLIENVMSYNPLLTYTIRFKKIYIQPKHYGNFTISQYKEAQFVNGNLTVPAEYTYDKAVGIFYRCDPDGINCEYFQTWTMKDLCSKLQEKNQIWSRWYGSFEPPLVCPFDKVHYRLINGTIDIGIAVLMYPQVTDYQWKVIQKFYAGDKHISTMTVEGSFFGYRRRTKSTSKL